MGASSHACARAARALVAAASLSCSCPCSSAVVCCCWCTCAWHTHERCSEFRRFWWLVVHAKDVCSEGPTGRRRVKGGVSGPAEDLRPVSEVVAGVNFRRADRLRGQVVQSPERRPGPGSRRSCGSAGTPSVHPEVSDTQFVSPGHGLGIRQSMGWKRVCGTAESRIWVLKGDARARMPLANLEHLRVERRKRGSYETAWVTPGHDCLCSNSYGHGAAVRPQTNDAIWDGVTGWRSSVAPLLSPWCTRGNVPTGVKLNRYAGSRSRIPWHSDNEPLFGRQNSPVSSLSV